MSRAGRLWGGLALSWSVVLPACHAVPRPPSSGLFLFEKGRYQFLYDAEGRLLRVVEDANGDGRAEAVLLYRPDGRLKAAEIDSDGDGSVDRWETFSESGALERVAIARHRPAQADEWDDVDASGALVRRSFDEDGDGRVDRVEDLEGGLVVREQVDTDHDGTMDRRVLRGPRGEVIGVAVAREGRWETMPAKP